MIKAKKILKVIGFATLGAIMFFVFNYLVLERIIIPDPCYYHSHDTTKIFDLFYELTASEGYHPTPTYLNLILTLTAGTATGLIWGLKKKVNDNNGEKNNAL